MIMIEQRLERCYHLADRILLMEKGRITCDGSAREVARKTSREDSPFLPPVARFFAGIEAPSLPLTVKEGRKLLRSCIIIERDMGLRPAAGKVGGTPADLAARGSAVRLKNLWFTYPGGQEVLKDVTLDVGEGEFVAVLGEKGAGKSTMLRQLTGLLRPDRGTVQVLGKRRQERVQEIRRHTAYLSQN